MKARQIKRQCSSDSNREHASDRKIIHQSMVYRILPITKFGGFYLDLTCSAIRKFSFPSGNHELKSPCRYSVSELRASGGFAWYAWGKLCNSPLVQDNFLMGRSGDRHLRRQRRSKNRQCRAADSHGTNPPTDSGQAEDLPSAKGSARMPAEPFAQNRPSTR